MTDANNLILFFDRPNEPIFLKKGDDAVFQLPNNYYPDKYKNVSEQLSDRFNDDSVKKMIPVRNISLPDMSLPLQLEKRSQFSLWIPKHRKMAAKLIDIMMGMRNVDDLQSVCAYLQPRCNPYLFNYCLSVALLHREDTKRAARSIPTFVEAFPDKFVDPRVFTRAREESTVARAGERSPIIVPRDYTASDAEPEHRVAYFREDLGVNLHHWHWHLVYPFDSSNRSVVDKDRRGELFYYMHQQMVARYNVERMCNNLPHTVPFNNFREPIPEGYFPKLDSTVASRAWPPRFVNTVIQDLNRPVDEIRVEVNQLEIWRDRFLEAIQTGSVQAPNGRSIPLTEEKGIDILGNLMESSILSVNRSYYGDLHNMGHVFIAYSHDPDHRHLEQFGVMGDSATAMRDPIFYRWHQYVDDLFQQYKQTLPKYDENRLNFPGIQVNSINISGGNNLKTFWQQSDVNMSRGLDFVPRGNVFARFTHLQHQEFEYVIDVNNTTGQQRMGTVRIFIAPSQDDRGRPLNFNQQRLLMIELDKFTTSLRPGKNSVRRQSTESSVTIPFERTFRNLDENRPQAGTAEEAEFNFCGCGWPQHMLIPKGTTGGFSMQLFCMISDWNDDRVEQDLVGSCNDAASYCGIRDRLYPDRRAMGYPFDRPGRQGVNTLQDFLTPNMAVGDCRITFNERVVMRGQN